jgi:hypothetical protein
LTPSPVGIRTAGIGRKPDVSGSGRFAVGGGEGDIDLLALAEAARDPGILRAG